MLKWKVSVKIRIHEWKKYQNVYTQMKIVYPNFDTVLPEVIEWLRMRNFKLKSFIVNWGLYSIQGKAKN